MLEDDDVSGVLRPRPLVAVDSKAIELDKALEDVAVGLVEERQGNPRLLERGDGHAVRQGQQVHRLLVVHQLVFLDAREHPPEVDDLPVHAV